MSDACMTYDTFAGRLRMATERCLDVARTCVRDRLPSDVAYWANWSVYNGLDLYEDEAIVWPNECRTEGKLLDESSILSILWHKNRFPRWINTQVDSIEQEKTVVCLTFSCCFGNDSERAHPNPTWPFVACSPIPPADGWKPGMEKFAIADSPGFRYPLASDGPLAHAGFVNFSKSDSKNSNTNQ